MCSRLSLECEEPRFNVAVEKVAHLQATRQTSRDESHERARNACATSAPTYLATLTSMRKRAAPSRRRQLKHGQQPWAGSKGGVSFFPGMRVVLSRQHSLRILVHSHSHMHLCAFSVHSIAFLHILAILHSHASSLANGIHMHS